MDRVMYFFFFLLLLRIPFPLAKLASTAEWKRRTDLRVEVAPSYTKSWGGKWCVVETTGITGNYTNDLLTLETGYLEQRAAGTPSPRFWMAPASKYCNERCNNQLFRSRQRYISLAIMGIKKIPPRPKNQRWLPDEYISLIAHCAINCFIYPRECARAANITVN